MRKLITTCALALALAACSTVEARPRACCGYVQITVLELYSPAVGSPMASGAYASLNSALIASGLGHIQVTRVAAVQRDFSGLTNFDLWALLPDDAGVVALRDQYAADVVIARHEGRDSWAGQGSPDSPSDRAGYMALAGNADVALLLHEFGHVLGVYHQRETWTTARGNCRHLEEPKFRDVLGDCTEGWISGVSQFPPVILQYSNPDVYYLGVPTGDDQHNAAAMVRVMAPVVAAYR